MDIEARSPEAGSERVGGLRPARGGAGRPAPATRPADSLIGRTLATDVLYRLRQDIIHGRLLPGARLRFEALRAAYHVSFGTLREGLQRLASESFVVADGQRGFIVAPVSLEELQDVTDARVLVEREVLRLAITRNAPDWRVRVEDAGRRLDGSANAATAALNAALASGCGSRVLLEIRAHLQDRAQRYRQLAAAHRALAEPGPAEDRALVDAALRGDAARAGDLIEAQLRRGSRDIAEARAAFAQKTP